MKTISHWVMDWETLSDCALVVFEHYKTNEVHVFTMGRLRNDIHKLLDFLRQNIRNGEWHISFNGLAFDSQITEFVIRNHEKLSKMTGVQIASKIYWKAQDAITRSNSRQFSEWGEHQLSIRQIDIFKLNHWDNPAKSSGLKWIQFTTDWPNLLDMPIHHDASITTVDQLKTIAEYCKNDVASTKYIAMQKCSKLIELRQTLSKQYSLNLYSASEPRIAKELFSQFLSKTSGIPEQKLKRLRTHRTSIQVRNILLPYLKYLTPEFKKMLFTFQHLSINALNTKNAFSYTLKYRGITTKLGLGGIHGAKPGIYQESDDMIIMSSDVVSYYPNLAIRNKWSPAHLPKEDFVNQYEWFFNERKKIPKKDPKNYVYKIILNSSFGLSIDKHSFLYDVQYGMATTINGQLLLMMLYEMLTEHIPGCIPIMQNTDGLETMIPKQYKEKYLEICKQWEQLTKLELEHDQYQKMIIRDVNNYVGIFKTKEVTREEYLDRQLENPYNVFLEKDGKYYFANTKCKGAFEFHDLMLHKNKSFLINRKALFNFFVHGIPPEDTIKLNRNIFDYCAGVKMKSGWKLIEKAIKDGNYIEIPLQKTIRYYSSKKGSKIFKVHNDGRIQNIEKAGQQTVYNLHTDSLWETYNVDEKFYLRKIHKEIKNLVPVLYSQQIALF